MSLVTAAAGRAELQWESKKLELHPPAGAAEAHGVFAFKNVGNTTVRIVDVRAACGCTVPALDREEYAPGESGHIRADYHVGDRRGPQAVAVVVLTAEPEPQTYELALHVDIKDYLTLSPRLLFWRIGDEVTPKSVELNVANGFTLQAANSTDEHFLVEVVEAPGGGRRLQVTPRDTGARRTASAILTVTPKEGGAPLESRVILRVL